MSKSAVTGGVHPSYQKGLASSLAIEDAPVPPRVSIPLSQHLGAPATPVVSKGDEVTPGMILAEAPKLISANVHSPVAGAVKNIVNKPMPGGRLADYIEIETDVDATEAHRWEPREVDLSDVDRKWLSRTMREAGIVGMGGATFPTDVKFSPPPAAELDTFILNGAECEPYLTCDHRMMVERTMEILKGVMLVRAAFSLRRVIVAIEKNKPDAIEAFREALRATEEPDIEVVPLNVLYPQGAEKVLIKAVTGRTVPAGGLPFEVGVVVSNVQTIHALYEAAYYEKPLTQRVLTISGAGIKQPKNIRACVGTPLATLVDFCGGYSEETTKVVAGGPMTGTALPTLDYSVTKGLSGLLFLTQKDYPEELPCIHCGRCVDVCPMRLMPLKLAAFAKAGKFEEAKATNLADCFECGACAWGCPSRIQLVAWIKYAKNYIRVKGI